ncbi:MAG: nitroreductase family protein [Dehalococcoidales bacterium]|nr:nitroreductase family protein [Dehalococcoidales bacterium]
MDIIEAIRTRRSMRSFKPDPVPRKVLEELLDISRWAPSGGNAQPWYFSVLGGKLLDEIKAKLEVKVDTSYDGTGFTDTHPELPRLSTSYPEALMPRVQSLRGPMYGSV